jgi:DNA-directed RNA polymerase subunit K/omega
MDDLLSQAIQSEGIDNLDETQLQAISTPQAIKILMEQDVRIKRLLTPTDMRHFATYTQLTPDEIERCKIQRDDSGRIIDKFHRSLPYLTKYERSGIVSERAAQLSKGYQPLIEDINPQWTNVQIAEAEVKKKALPMILKRRLPNGTTEYWPLEELIDIHY